VPIWPYQFFCTLQSDRRSGPIIIVYGKFGNSADKKQNLFCWICIRERLPYRYCMMHNFWWISNNRSGVALYPLTFFEHYRYSNLASIRSWVAELVCTVTKNLIADKWPNMTVLKPPVKLSKVRCNIWFIVLMNTITIGVCNHNTNNYRFRLAIWL